MQTCDQNSDHVLLVLVYPDAAAAQLDRDRAMIRDEHPVDGNPHLVTGYGSAVWNDNVAVVQSTQSQLDLMYTREANVGMRSFVGVAPAVLDTQLPNTAVDMDFLHALNGSAVNL